MYTYIHQQPINRNGMRDCPPLYKTLDKQDLLCSCLKITNKPVGKILPKKLKSFRKNVISLKNDRRTTVKK